MGNNKLTDTIFSIVIIGFCYTCNKQPLSNKSIDFTNEFVFTKGIEGPATDSKGNLYAVNFKEEGTIGIVDETGKASLFSFKK